MNRKAQISMEYLLVAGFAFLSIVPIIIIFFTQSQNFNQDVTLAQVDKVMSEMIDAADTVYYQGAPSTKSIRVSIPSYVEDVILNGSQHITFVVRRSDSAATMNILSRPALANLTGDLTHAAGIHTLRVHAFDGTFVNITDDNS